VPFHPEIVIGRSSSCDLSLNDAVVSRHHARLSVVAGELFVNDLNSTNGTVVNDAEIDRGSTKGCGRRATVAVGKAEFDVVIATAARAGEYGRALRDSVRDAKFPIACNMVHCQNVLADLDGRVARDRFQYGLLVLDVDKFKTINSRFGYAGGDAVLRELLELLESELRPHEVLAKIGGEELLLVIPGAAREQVLETAERIRGRVQRQGFHARADLAVPITISIGASMVGHDGRSSSKDALAEAQELVRIAKDRGRNQVVTARDVDAPVPLPRGDRTTS
jgi:two-component system cell cycle response regulator